jgi:hypothetical protein
MYESTKDFLEMAVPFVDGGLALGEPVLVVSTPANLELLSGALWARSHQVDYLDTAQIGQRPAQRIAALYQYWCRHGSATRGNRVRVLAEPVWMGMSPRQVIARKRLESSLNEIFADTNIWMICPYNTRVVEAEIVADARRTHPARIVGDTAEQCHEYMEPAQFFRAHDAPLPEPPPDAALLVFSGDFYDLRRFVATRAAAHRLTGRRITMLAAAAHEVVTYLTENGPDQMAVRVWAQPGEIHCEVHQPGGNVTDPLIGFRPPSLPSQAGDELWFPRLVCDFVDIHSTETACTVRLSISTFAEE